QIGDEIDVGQVRTVGEAVIGPVDGRLARVQRRAGRAAWLAEAQTRAVAGAQGLQRTVRGDAEILLTRVRAGAVRRSVVAIVAGDVQHAVVRQAETAAQRELIVVAAAVLGRA